MTRLRSREKKQQWPSIFIDKWTGEIGCGIALDAAFHRYRAGVEHFAGPASRGPSFEFSQSPGQFFCGLESFIFILFKTF
jgi:hypothetical protein